MLRMNKQGVRRGLLCLLWLTWALAGNIGARAQIMQGESFDLDFTRADLLKGRVATFPEALTFSAAGLGYDADANRLLPRTRFQTTEPIALGYAWTPTASVAIRARLNTDFKFIGAYALGQLYARYSPDAAHWSSWQNVAGDKRADKTARTHTYAGQLIVPDVTRVPYFDLLQQFYKAQPEQAGDEEAAVRWIVQKDARYFEKTLPFIGYVQFLFETPLTGGQHLTSLHCDLFWPLPGLHVASKRERDAQKNNAPPLPWRYRTAPARAKRAPESSRAQSSEYAQWVAKALAQMQALHPGMKRANLDQLFTMEGGIRGGLTYVYRECPLIKVDFEFKRAPETKYDREGRVISGLSPNDEIISISKPYLQYAIYD